MKLSEKEISRLEFARQSERQHPEIKFSGPFYLSSSAVIGSSGFGWARNEEGVLEEVKHSGGVKIGTYVQIREFVTIDQATVKGTYTTIGESTKLDHFVHIAHNAKIGNHNTIAAHCIIEGSCIVGDYNTFGAGVIMQTKTKLGNGNTVGSGSVITKDFSEVHNAVIIGSPARIIKYKE